MAIDEDKLGKCREGRKGGKLLLRKMMEGLIPQEILESEKQGFIAPDGSWFRGESIEYISPLLLDPKAQIYEYFTTHYVVQKRLEEHVSEKFNHRLFIWSLLSFGWWLRQFMRN